MDSNSPWGIVLHSASEWDISELHKGGVAFLRIDFVWATVQPQDGPFSWLHFDRLVRWAADRGMWIVGNLLGTPKWALAPGHPEPGYRPDAYPPANLQKWKDYVAAVVGRYGARVRYWTVWNEPDSRDEPKNVCFWRGTQAEWFNDIAAKAFEAIPASSGLNLCMPDLAKADNSSWINEALTRFGSRLHAITVHSYKGGGDGSDVIDRARTAKGLVESYNASHGRQIQLWITETGWQNTEHAEGTISDKIQDLCREVRRNPWMKKVFPYVWSDGYLDSFNFKIHARGLRQQWTGYKTGINAPQPAVAFERDSLVTVHNIPAQMTRGQVHNGTLTMRNIGRWTWPRQGTIRLGYSSQLTALGPPYSVKVDIIDARLQQLMLKPVSGFNAPARLQVLDRAPVPPQGETTFNFQLTAPAQPGTYLIGWCMVDDNAADPMWFGQGLLQRMNVA